MYLADMCPFLVGCGMGKYSNTYSHSVIFKVHIKAYFCQGAVPDFEFLLYLFFVLFICLFLCKI